MNYQKAQQELTSGKSLLYCDDATIKYAKQPIGKGILKTGRPKKPENEKSKGNETIKCEICGKQYKRYNSSAHKKTQYHQVYLKVDKKMRNLILND